jgi:hypothetical protein
MDLGCVAQKFLFKFIWITFLYDLEHPGDESFSNLRVSASMLLELMGLGGVSFSNLRVLASMLHELMGLGGVGA